MVTDERLCSGNKTKLQQDCFKYWSNLFIKFQKTVKCHVSVTNELTLLIYLPDVQCHGPVTNIDFIYSFFWIKLISNNMVFVYWVPLSQHQCPLQAYIRILQNLLNFTWFLTLSFEMGFPVRCNWLSALLCLLLMGEPNTNICINTELACLLRVSGREPFFFLSKQKCWLVRTTMAFSPTEDLSGRFFSWSHL